MLQLSTIDITLRAGYSSCKGIFLVAVGTPCPKEVLRGMSGSC